ncbi:histidine kinase [Herpetosiphon giganteus]|uniref:histidine kinase n=1 Tax=Herpetosiphon giganteus TaxID=2029754 RepID=UPI00195C96FE|nr:signal transduction histidine kinase [Herpetosiphon giganteus]
MQQQHRKLSLRHRLRQRFGTLRWKLTWSYVWISVALTLLINTLAFIVVMGAAPPLNAPTLLSAAQNHAAEFSAVLQEPTDSRTIQQVLRYRFGSLRGQFLQNNLELAISNTVNNTPSDLSQEIILMPAEAFTPEATNDFSQSYHLLLLDAKGTVLGGTFPRYTPAGQPWNDSVIGNDRRVVQAALAGSNDIDQLTWTYDNYLVIATPILDQANQVIGALYVRSRPLSQNQVIVALLMVIIFMVSSVVSLIANAIIGMVYGWFVARNFVRRLVQLTKATDSLAAGNLSVRVNDTASDEIGQLARRFDSMAQELESNVKMLRQLADRNAALVEQAGQLAIVEERNRLARDLHDSVSQELFSVTMLAAAARNLLPAQPDKARSQVEQLSQMAQRALHETRGLIFALRPAALGDQGLVPALRQLVEEAARRQGLQIQLNINGERRIPLDHEQAFYRICQEALANITKHSGVNSASVNLEYEAQRTILEVSDRGRGFDLQQPRNSHSLGLISIQERANAVGGTVEVTAAPGQGTSLRIVVPRSQTGLLVEPR